MYLNNGQAVVLRNTSSVKHTYRNCTNYILDQYISNMTTFFTFLLESQGKRFIMYIVMVVYLLQNPETWYIYKPKQLITVHVLESLFSMIFLMFDFDTKGI